MMKKLCCLMLSVLLCACAFAESIPFADTALDKAALTARYGAVSDENGGFTAMSPKAKALETLFIGKIATYAAGGMLMFNAQVEGNFETGISFPVLRIVYAGGAPLNANTVMFSVNGEVYALSVVSNVTNYGRYRVETMKAYLNEEGFALLESLKNSDEADVTILGNDQYTQEAKKAQFYASQKLEISAECLTALDLPEGVPDFADYDLKALSEKAFEAKYGKETKIEKVDTAIDCGMQLDKTFYLAADNAPGATIKAVQDLLKKNGFMAGTTGMQMTSDMISAVKAAQGYYGLDVTGYADARLIKMLNENLPVQAKTEENASVAYAFATDQISFNVNRWWLADRAETTYPGGGVYVSDSDNVFVVFDGEIASRALKSLSLSWEVKAELVKDGKYAFPCAVYTEVQGGSVLSTTLGVLREGRLIIVCEIPDAISDMDGEWTLTISESGNVFELNLAK